MNEDEYKQKFESLAEGLQMERLYDQLADRAEIARVVALHCAEIYRTARRAGLPRSLAIALAKDHWASEMSPVTTFYLSGGEG